MDDSPKKLLEELLQKKSVSIRGVKKIVVGMARYATTNNPDSEYVKVAFCDGSGMCFSLDDQTVYYFDRKLGEAETGKDGQLGQLRELEWRGMKFTIENANDYQYVKELYVGTIHEVEGEVRFSDYADAEGNVLSLGWNMFENRRDDVYAEPLRTDEWGLD